VFELNIDDCKVTVATVLLLITTAPPRVEALFFVNVLEASTAAVLTLLAAIAPPFPVKESNISRSHVQQNFGSHSIGIEQLSGDCWRALPLARFDVNKQLLTLTAATPSRCKPPPSVPAAFPLKLVAWTETAPLIL